MGEGSTAQYDRAQQRRWREGMAQAANEFWGLARASSNARMRFIYARLARWYRKLARGRFGKP